MRRSVFLLTPLIPLAVAACEDGPAQTFSPATGTLFNNGDTPAAVADGGDPLNFTTGGATKTQICNGDELQKQWGAMVAQPIAPARYMAGIDLDDGPSFPLLSVEKAELGPTQPIQMQCTGAGGATSAACSAHNSSKTPQGDCAIDYANNCEWYVQLIQPSPTALPSRLCQPTVLGPGGNGNDVGGSLLVQWGNNGEFQMEWAIPTHKAYVMNLNPGYTGHMTWNYRTPVVDSAGKTTACTANAQCTTKNSMCDTTNSVCVQGHAYDYAIGLTIKKDGAPYVIDWNNSKAYPGEVDELYRGIASTFAPDIFDNAPPGTFCNATGTCLAYANAQDGTGRALFGMRPVSFYMFFNPPTLPAPSGYTVQSAYLFNIKYAPYSGTTSYFKMYDGPTDGGTAPGDPSQAQPFADKILGTKKIHCHFGMGDNFKNLLDNCIDVFTDSALNTASENKVLGNLAHDDQNFTFSVVGINQNFHPAALDICPNPNGQVGNPLKAPAGSNCGTRTTDVLHDSDSPMKDPTNSVAITFDSDVRSFGPIQNDQWPDATVPGLWHKDFHGSGTVWREYARLVQTDLAAQYTAAHGTAQTCSGGTHPICTPNPKEFRDPSCYFPMGCQGPAACAADTAPSACNNDAAGCTWTVPPGFDPTTWRPAAGCTGFESMISAAEPMANANYPLPKAYGPAATAADDVFDQSYARIYAGAGGGAKPGTPLVLFCNDPSFNGQWFVSSNNFCALAGDLIGAYGDLLSTSTSRVLQYLGFGDVLNLPLEARDRRYFFKRWSQAYAKYLTSPAVLATGNHGSGQVPDYSQTLIDTDHFIFDSFGGGASRSEYISFDFADSVHDPVSVEQKILVLGSNLQATNFYRKLDREERALYNSLAIDRTQAAWGYLHDKTTGATITDFWPVQGAAGNITCTTNAACQAINPAYVCDTAAPATSTNAGVCVRAYARKNGNPFLTNMTGSIAIITGAVNTVGQTWSAAGNPAPLDWFDPCNPTTGQTCATSADCTGQLTCCPAADPSGCTVNTCVPAKTAYYCATHIDGDCINAGSNLPPLDPNTGAMIVRENGKPFFEGYCGIWQKSPFALQPNAITDANLAGVVSGAKVVKTFPDEGEALVQMPSYKNPYVLDAKAVDPPIQVMVPWYPFQEGVGYPVMASGTRDVFVTTAQLDFTGQVVTPVMDIIPVVDTPCNTAADCPAGDSCPSDTKTCVDPNPTNPTPPYSFQLEAIETQDFLGDVFLCVDPVTSANRAGTSVPGDVLAAHMYTSAATVIDWLAAHPGAQDACQIVVRYSPYDNYPDFIQSSLNGVRLGVEQGAGYGRITDATVFAPGTGTVAPP